MPSGQIDQTLNDLFKGDPFVKTGGRAVLDPSLVFVTAVGAILRIFGYCTLFFVYVGIKYAILFHRNITCFTVFC